MSLVDKVCVVTGAGRGLGRACAQALAKEDAILGILDVDADAASATADALIADGARAFWQLCDVRDGCEVEAAFDRVVDALGPLDVLVNNAGIGAVWRTEELPESEWDKVLDTCLKGTFLCSKEAARRMIPRGTGGTIVNMSSMMGLVSMPTRAAYCSAKAGVIALTKVTAGEWGRYGIRVNAVAPGVVETEGIRDAIAKDLMDRDTYLKWVPQSRLGTVEEVADAVVFLASDAAPYVTGHTLVIDGGFSAYDAYWEPAVAGDVAPQRP